MNNMTHTRFGRMLRLASAWTLAASLLAAPTSGPAAGQLPPAGNAGQSGAPGAAATVQGYKIAGVNVESVAGKLQEMFGGEGVRIFGEPRTGQIIVSAPQAAQKEISDWLAGQRLLAADGAAAPLAQAASPTGQPPAPPAGQKLVTQSWQLRNITWKDFETKLAKTWGKALESSQDPVGDIATFRFPATPEGSTSIVVDRSTSLATIVSPVVR